MKILYFNCESGISGDMTIAALVDLGVPAEYLVKELEKLHIGSYDVEFKKVLKNHISANSLATGFDEHTGHVHRNYLDIVKMIEKSELNDNIKQISLNIFSIVAEAEAKVHGVLTSEVTFHEVGALDSIVDVVGTAICVDYLKPDKVITGVVNEGCGFTECAHGKMPVPAPAVLEIFAANKVKFSRVNIEGELVTPTGAAIIAALTDSYSPPSGLTVLSIGYGAGKKTLDIPNVLRVCMCDVMSDTFETVTIIETNIDDQTAETLAFAMERLMIDGAKDVFFTNIQMKKNRPGVMLSVICDDKDVEKMCSIIFHNTTTIGVRFRREKRICLMREYKTVETPYGPVDAKVSYFENRVTVMPEYESVKKVALANNAPIIDIYNSVTYRAAFDKEPV